MRLCEAQGDETTREGAVGTNHAVLLLLPTQGWRSAREAPNKSWCWLCSTASHTESQPLLQELLHSEQVLSPRSRAGAALSCTDMNSLLGMYWAGGFSEQEALVSYYLPLNVLGYLECEHLFPLNILMLNLWKKLLLENLIKSSFSLIDSTSLFCFSRCCCF